MMEYIYGIWMWRVVKKNFNEQHQCNFCIIWNDFNQMDTFSSILVLEFIKPNKEIA